MRIKNKEIVALKRRLKLAGVTGLALDIDETLSFTIGFMVEKLIEKFGNPENLSVEEICKKYRHTDKIPYWQSDEVNIIINEIVHSNEIQKELPLIKNSNKLIQEINKLVPIVAYITVRPVDIISGTNFWLKKHNFPKATIIAKPRNINRKMGNKWKAKVLEYLYPQVVGIVDDNPDLTKFFSKKYKGVIYLYDHTEAERKDINVIPCDSWETVAKKVKECKL
ncbi:MAG: hypothetical protein WCT51_02920 [Candidatus Shapirobacteria bacterium]|jgi:hypothetical protein